MKLKVFKTLQYLLVILGCLGPIVVFTVYLSKMDFTLSAHSKTLEALELEVGNIKDTVTRIENFLDPPSPPSNKPTITAERVD